jgi:hypothetical protein
VISQDQQELEALAKVDGVELVRATGFCCVCDSRFKDAFVVRYLNSSMPGGWAYVEPRHLRDRSTSHDAA